MLTAFALRDGRLQRLPATASDTDLEASLWIDLAEPTAAERARVEGLHQQALPLAADLKEIEASSRSAVTAHGLHIASLFLHRTAGRDETVNGGLLLTPQRLITLHGPELLALRLLRMRAGRGLVAGGVTDLVEQLFEIKLDYLADTLEEIHERLDDIADGVLKPSADLAGTFDALTRIERLNSKVRLCLVDAQRDLTFLMRHGEVNKVQQRSIESLLRDADSLLPHCSFLFEKVGFLLQALHGAINIEQNKIIKFFSVVAVVFLPPTLIASIYGMNFDLIPELSWSFGYPLAILLMVISAIAPYLYFKRRGWF